MNLLENIVMSKVVNVLFGETFQDGTSTFKKSQI
jgi:hypothetical protein